MLSILMVVSFLRRCGGVAELRRGWCPLASMPYAYRGDVRRGGLLKLRRERWWRRTASAFRWTSLDFADDAAADAIATAAETMNLEHQVAMVRAWASASAEDHARWPEGPFSTDSWMRATDDELAEFSRELIDLIRRWADRPLPDDGVDREPVFVFARAVPGQP
jgi:hypothetical protein